MNERKEMQRRKKTFKKIVKKKRKRCGEY